MNQELLETLLTIDNPEHYPLLIEEQNLSLPTIQQLKDHSAQFRFSNPAETLRIAQVAYDLSLHMDQEAQALGQWTLGNAMMHSGDFRRADQLFQAAREAYFAANNLLDAARMGLGHVVVLGYIGETDRALVLAKEIEPILDSASQNSPEDLERLGKLLMNLGNVYELIGQYEEALEIYQRQVPIAEELGNQLLLAQAKHNQAYAYAQLNVYADAQQLYDEAEQVFISHDASQQLITLYINLTLLHVSFGQYKRAREIHQKAGTQLAKSGKADWQVYRLPALQAQIELGDAQPINDELIASLAEAQAHLADSGSTSQEGVASTILGQCYLERREFVAAEKTFTQLISLAESSADPLLRFHALAGLAQTFAMQGDNVRAITLYEDAIQQMESVRQDLQIDSFRAGFLTDKLSTYKSLVSLYLLNDDMALAFQTVERSKALLITEKLAARTKAELGHLAQSASGDLKPLGDELANALQKLDELYPRLRLQSVTQDSNLVLTSETISNLEKRAQVLARRIQRAFPKIASLSLQDTTSLRELASILDERLFLQFYLQDEYVYCFAIEKSGLVAHRQLAPIAAIENARKLFSASVERLWELQSKLGVEKTINFLPQLLSDCQRHLGQLYQLLIHPLEELFSNHTNITIAPDGPLYYIPFHALYNGKTYLAEQHVVHYVPNATSYLFCKQLDQLTPERSYPVDLDDYQDSLLMGCNYEESLSHAGREIETVARCLKTHDKEAVSVFLNEEATTSNFIMNVKAARHIHLASHAEFRIDKPMLSSITLSDRRISLAEISQLEISAELVVLSGCETGQGLLAGSDSISLASGFLGAGARSLMVSLWKIEDTATAAFMNEFYQGYLSDHDIPLALTSAQRCLLECGRQSAGNEVLYQHPAYWAPFLVFGND